MTAMLYYYYCHSYYYAVSKGVLSLFVYCCRISKIFRPNLSCAVRMEILSLIMNALLRLLLLLEEQLVIGETTRSDNKPTEKYSAAFSSPVN